MKLGAKSQTKTACIELHTFSNHFATVLAGKFSNITDTINFFTEI